MTLLQALDESVAAELRQPFRPNYPRGPVSVVLPMPATPDDLATLRRLLEWAGGRNLTQTERALRDGLARALGYLEEPDQRKNVVLYILSALRHSMKRLQSGNMWVCVDRDLHNWAMEQIEQLFPDRGDVDHVTLRHDDKEK